MQWNHWKWKFWGRMRSYRQERCMTWNVRASVQSRRRSWPGGSPRSSWRGSRKTWVTPRAFFLALREAKTCRARTNRTAASCLIASPHLTTVSRYEKRSLFLFFSLSITQLYLALLHKLAWISFLSNDMNHFI